MKRRALYGVGALALVVLLGAITASYIWWSASGEPTDVTAPAEVPIAYQAGPFRLGVGVEPSTPRVGDNELTLRVEDSAGRPVSGAVVRAVAEMPAMGAMAAMRAPADIVEVDPGVYRGSFAPSMAGSWPLTIEILHEEGGQARVTFDLATGREGLVLSSGARHLDGAAPEAPSPMASMPGMSQPMTGAAPVGADDSSFRVGADWQQAIGVRTAPVRTRTLAAELRLPGRVEVDETGLVDVNLKTSGWIERLVVEETGQYVEAGQRLLDLYSPELVTAQRDLLLAIENDRLLADSPNDEARERGASLVAASRRRLARLGLDAPSIEEIVAGGDLHETLPLLAPASGFVLEKMAVEGMRVEPGMRLFRIADLSTAWILVDVYEGDATFVRLGQRATFRLAYEPETTFRGRVDYVYPTLDADSRSVRVRLEVPNPGLRLRPGMYGDVLLTRELGPELAIPAEAVLDLGRRHVVFVDLGDARLQAREVALGPKAGGWYPVRAGLMEGESVVVSGNFLIDAESKVRGVVPLPLDGQADARDAEAVR